LRHLFLELAPFGLYTSIPYLNLDPEKADLVKPFHYKAGLYAKRRIYNFGDYWLYGGRKKLSTEEYDENEEFRKIVTKNLTSTRDTYEPLGDHIQRRHEVEVRVAQTLEVPEKKKRESGAQRRKRKRAEQIAEEGLRDTLCR
jgi:hypothetical protein